MRHLNRAWSPVPEKALIAIVDDEEPVRRALGRLVQALGMDVVLFAGGGDFLERLEREALFRPDAVLLDIYMPAVSGFDVLERLRHLQPPVPAVVVTAHDEPALRERVMNDGAVAMLRKPVSDDALLAALRLALPLPRTP